MPAYRKRRYVRKVATARRVYRRRSPVYRKSRSYVRRAPARRRVYRRVARRSRRAYPARTRVAYGGFSARRMAPIAGKRTRDLDIHAVSQGSMFDNLDD